MTDIKAITVEDEDGCQWVKRSLVEGSDVSTSVLGDISLDRGSFHTFVSSNWVGRELKFAEGGCISSHSADAFLGSALEDLIRDGASCVVIEDDRWKPSDPAIVERTGRVAFIGDHVVHWHDLQPGFGIEAAEAVRKGALGYPLNAFVSTMSAGDLGLVDGEDAPKSFPGAVTESLLAVVVSAFDAESYLVWTP
jgi:hypothetical protein